MTIAGIFGDVGNDTWLTDVLVGGLESMIKGFPNDGLTVVTDQKTVRIITEARHSNVELLSKAKERPHVVFLINGGKDHLKLFTKAERLGVPVYQIFNSSNPMTDD